MLAGRHASSILVLACVCAAKRASKQQIRRYEGQLLSESSAALLTHDGNVENFASVAHEAGTIFFDNTGKIDKIHVAGTILATMILFCGCYHCALRPKGAWLDSSGRKRSLDSADALHSKRGDCMDADPIEDANKAKFLEMCRDAGALDEKGEYVGFFHDPFALKDFGKEELRKFFPRVCFALVFNTLCTYLNNISQAQLQQSLSGYYESRWKPAPSVHTGMMLWDVTFEYLPMVPSTKPGDFLAMLLPLVGIFRFIVIPGPLSMRWVVLNRIMFIWGLLWLARAFFMWFTILPSPDPTCIPRVSFPDNVWKEAFVNLPFMKWAYNELTCRDMMFSGHAMGCTVFMLGVLWYAPITPWTYWRASHKWYSLSSVFNILCLGVLFVEYYLITASHYHYTLDVVVGAWISVMVFFGYHYFLRSACRCDESSPRLIYNFIEWYEYHSSDMGMWRKKTTANLKTLAETACK